MHRHRRRHFLLLLFLLLLFLPTSFPDASADKIALLAFLSELRSPGRVRWNSSLPACSFTGVTCDGNLSSVTALRLPGSGLAGDVPFSSLSLLSSLRVLSLRSNFLSGDLPSDLGNLTSLRALYLQRNRLSGPLPSSFSRLRRLARLDLSGNNLTGPLAPALSDLTRLTSLLLHNNSFTGTLESLDLPNLRTLDVSFNNLSGSIPPSLQRFPVTSFVGNPDLCGLPLLPCRNTSSSGRRLSTPAIIAISVASAVALLVVITLLVCYVVCRRRNPIECSREAPPKVVAAGTLASKSSDSRPKSFSTSSTSAGLEAAQKFRLSFLGNVPYRFGLEDLLRASAEMLGKGNTGTTYKAVLENGTTVVVKRLKDVAASRPEFELLMLTLGRVHHHDNLVPLRAFYHSKDEKLLVYDFLEGGSLSALLHGGRRRPVVWRRRLQIALSVANGLAHLHGTARLVHGNVSASNVMVGIEPDGSSLADVGLWQLFGSAGGAVGYRAPELTDARRPTYKSDVYAYGVLLLELLTGRSPTVSGGLNLVSWVKSMPQAADSFDPELLADGGDEEAIAELLLLAIGCTADVANGRPEMAEVAAAVEEMERRAAGMEGESDRDSRGGDL